MNNINIVVGIGGVLIGLALNYKSFRRTQDKDLKADTKEDTELKVKLDYIQRGVDDIKLNQKDQDRKMSDISDRLIRVEESTKSAHHRIDTLEKGE